MAMTRELLGMLEGAEGVTAKALTDAEVAVEHRATIATMRAETAEAKARMITAQRLAEVARQTLLTASADLRPKVFALLDARAAITDSTNGLQVHLQGSVAHDLLLTGIEAPAHAVLATAHCATAAGTTSARQDKCASKVPANPTATSTTATGARPMEAPSRPAKG